MANRVNDNIIMENARIIFRNFSGKESKYNRKGSRNFCVIIDDVELANKLDDEGWNIRRLEPREEGDEPKYYLQVQVSYENIPPKVYMVTRKTKTLPPLLILDSFIGCRATTSSNRKRIPLSVTFWAVAVNLPKP